MTDWKALRRTIEDATPGPWWEVGGFAVYRGHNGDAVVVGEAEDAWDAPLIATARDALPEMLALLVEAREAIEAINEAHFADHGADVADEDSCDTCAELAGIYSEFIARLPESE